MYALVIMTRILQHNTFLVAVDFVRPEVLTVIKVVADQGRADATVIGAPELLLLTYRCWRRHFCSNTSVTELVIPIAAEIKLNTFY